MTDLLTILREELDWPLRYPPVPELTDDTILDQRWFCPVDRCCVQMKLDELLGREIPHDEAEAWQSVADIRRSFERTVLERVDG